jgi:hypothetical protein
MRSLWPSSVCRHSRLWVPSAGDAAAAVSAAAASDMLPCVVSRAALCRVPPTVVRPLVVRRAGPRWKRWGLRAAVGDAQQLAVSRPLPPPALDE